MLFISALRAWTCGKGHACTVLVIVFCASVALGTNFQILSLFAVFALLRASFPVLLVLFDDAMLFPPID
jgi:hypothetical protein